MKILLAVAFSMFISAQAQASTDVNISFSSAVYSGVKVSSGSVVRVDNWVHGVQSGTSTLQMDRNAVVIQNHDSADDIYCGYNTSVATATASGYLGLKIIPDATGVFGVDMVSTIYCMAVDAAGAAGVRVHITQTGRK